MLGGALSVGVVNGFVPHVGDTFTILHDTSGTAVSGTLRGCRTGPPSTAVSGLTMWAGT